MSFMFQRFIYIVIFAFCSLSLSVQADKINVAVASNFIAPMKALAQAFESNSPHKLTISSASSGKLYAQIIHGAPFDLFLSADQDKPKRLIESGKAVERSLFTYAQGTLALWSSDDQFIHEGITTLRQGDYSKLALANPRLAPYGEAAMAVLEQLDLVSITRSRWVQGENISQTFQFVRSGSAQLGFVALSQIQQNGEIKKGSVWLLPQEWYPPILQDAVLLQTAKDKPAAAEFLSFMKSDTAKAIIGRHGYKTL